MDIQFKGYTTIKGTRSGISLLFDIDGKEYQRVSLLNTNQLLWWKREESEYLTKDEVNEIEPIIRDLFHDKIKELKPLPLINLVPEN